MPHTSPKRWLETELLLPGRLLDLVAELLDALLDAVACILNGVRQLDVVRLGRLLQRVLVLRLAPVLGFLHEQMTPCGGDVRVLLQQNAGRLSAMIRFVIYLQHCQPYMQPNAWPHGTEDTTQARSASAERGGWG